MQPDGVDQLIAKRRRRIGARADEWLWLEPIPLLNGHALAGSVGSLAAQCANVDLHRFAGANLVDALEQGLVGMIGDAPGEEIVRALRVDLRLPAGERRELLDL